MENNEHNHWNKSYLYIFMMIVNIETRHLQGKYTYSLHVYSTEAVPEDSLEPRLIELWGSGCTNYATHNQNTLL